MPRGCRRRGACSRCPRSRSPPGGWDVDAIRRDANVRGTLLGVFIADGTLTADVLLRDRVCSRLAARGDFVLFDGEDEDSLPARSRWSVHSNAVVLAFDDRVLSAVTRWPHLLAGVLQRIARQLDRTLRAQAVSQLPRIEDRLLGLLWNLADEIGHVRPDGVYVDVPLTHEALGRMVGARRPTVSLGLQVLAEEELLHKDGEGWLLAPESLERFEAVAGGSDALPRRRASH